MPTQKFVSAIEGGITNDANTPRQLLHIAAPKPSDVSGTALQKKLVAGVATVESGIISGSGFFISQDGYLLTNQNVVGAAKFVKITLSNGVSTIGEVVRVDNSRNIALVKTEIRPSEVLSIRLSPVEIGEAVTGVGSPRGKSLAGTITHGIISAKRTENGNSYLQSDVANAEGSMGGPWWMRTAKSSVFRNRAYTRQA